ncbi:MAG: glycosyltransferase family 39 protein [Pseudodesulfovibrio sp.]|nr:glycosyltransferase family 39 protein [Pseudodesulfovibrio sp.]
MARIISRIWNRLENHPWLTMIVAVSAQTWFTLNNRALWFSDEVRYANAYQNLVQHGKWMVLSLNGQPYPDKPPVYFWFLWLIDTVTPADMPTVFFLGAALSGLFFLGAAYFLARTLGFNKTVSLASVLILLSTFFLTALFHYSRMDLMFTALIILSHACLFKAFNDEQQGHWPLYAFLLAGIATLVKGPLGFIFPLITSGVYLLWKSELKKLFTRQMLLGFMSMIALLTAWVAGVMAVEGPSFLVNTVVGKHVIQRATQTFHHRESIYYYFAAFPLAWLPWTLFIAVTPVRKILSPEYLKELWTNRRMAGPRTFLWIMFITIFAFLSSLSGKVLIYILPMFPPLAILIGDTMQTMNEKRTTRLWTLIAGLWGVFGLGLILAGDLLPFPVPVRGLGIAACLLIIGGAVIFTARKHGNKAGLLCSVLALILWLHPIGLMVAPSLDNAMSPKQQSLKIGQYIKDGYTPLAYKIYSGIFTYYAQHDLNETGNIDEIVRTMDAHDKVVLVIREKHWKTWPDHPADLKVTDRQDIAGMIYLLVVKD